ncbi:dienelactone hydrolase family protein [Methylibium rhizosphaerae]|uniref:dienelactone hydrolase family protein n=1 Tax=Methylibium rhizosphaerae TaxID=2570323 RepID=UPI00112BE8E6|nr:dienelactone hydrolase family protein [Methylibium rhizosphaerae]
MGTMIELEAADGHRFGAYLAAPEGAPRGGLVVVQEIFGVNSHIRAVADGYARDGYLVIAPALFDRAERGIELGYGTADMERGRALKAAAAGQDTTEPLLDITAAIEQIEPAGRVGIVGYCWGGYVAWLAAARLPGLAAAVTYYGGGMQEAAQLQPLCPVLAHFGETDAHIPVARVRQFAAARPEVAVHLYDAGHGFNCDQRGSYDEASARLARERTLAFLHEHVG